MSGTPKMAFIRYTSAAFPRGVVGILSANGKAVKPVRHADGAFVENLFDVIEDWDVSASALQPGAPEEERVKVEILAPLVGRDVLAVGKNYKEHAKEFQQSGYDSSDKNEQPDFPVIFTKRASSIVADGTPIYPHPNVTASLDYEGELGVIIGKGGIGIKKEDAWKHVWGATIINDITARERQRDHKQFFIGKSLDTFCPMGPCAVHAASLDWNNMILETRVNGELRQSQNTKDLIFDIPTLIETCSMGITLMPGDIIATGTPAGVGIGKNPPSFLKEGDKLEVSITSLGTLTNTIGRSSDPAPRCTAVREPRANTNPNCQLVTLSSGDALYIDTKDVDEARPTVLFIHGLGGSSSNYDAVIAASGIGEKYNALKYDLMGHGLSPLATQSLSIEAFVESAVAVLDHCHAKKAIVVGHSMGGLIATSLAAKYPERVEKLFLIGPVKAFAEAGVKALGGRAETVSKGGMPSVADTIVSGGTAQKTKDARPLALAAVRASLLNSPALGYAAACRALAAAQDPQYQHISCETLILQGSEDKTSPPATSAFLADKIRNSKILNVDAVGHWHLLEDVDTVAAALANFVN